MPLNLLQPVCAICHRLWGRGLLVPADAKVLKILVRWGDYIARTAEAGELGPFVWARTPREEEVLIDLPEKTRSRLSTPSQPLAAWWSPSPSVRC